MHRRVLAPSVVRGLHASMSTMAKPKRFYKNVSVVKSNSSWEINLDKRKLKTPAGQVLMVPNESLATAVATEWDVQKDTIQRHAMHLTALCNTAQDNPHNKTREQLCDEIIEYFENDSLLFRLPESEQPDLHKLQKEKWDPILEWFSQRYQIDLTPTSSVIAPVIPTEVIHTIYKDLLSHSRATLFGMQFAVGSLKSYILTKATIDRRLSVEEAVKLSRLEVDYQTAVWGSVEWSHELDEKQVQARLAASVLYIQLRETKSDNIVKKV